MGRPKESRNKNHAYKKSGITLADIVNERTDIKDVIRITKESMLKLEGVSEALKPFHPRLGTYIEAQINDIYRAIYSYEKPGTPAEWRKLSPNSAPGWEEVDKEIEEGKVSDEMMEDLEELS